MKEITPENEQTKEQQLAELLHLKYDAIYDKKRIHESLVQVARVVAEQNKYKEEYERQLKKYEGLDEKIDALIIEIAKEKQDILPDLSHKWGVGAPGHYENNGSMGKQ